MIHEISMVGCTLLATMHVKVKKIKSNLSSFESINIMFMRDFLQFSQIIDMPLHSTNVQPYFLPSQNYVKKIHR